jgi:hypothetical protein
MLRIVLRLWGCGGVGRCGKRFGFLAPGRLFDGTDERLAEAFPEATAICGLVQTAGVGKRASYTSKWPRRAA